MYTTYKLVELPPVMQWRPLELPDLTARRSLHDQIQKLSYLFRVFDDQSSATYHPTRGFRANRFRDSPAGSLPREVRSHDPSNLSSAGEDAVTHIQFFKRGNDSPWISTSPLWLWAITKAIKRLRQGKSNVRLAIIDIKHLPIVASCRGPRQVFYGVELIREGTEKDHEETVRLTNSPQEILVYGSIPRDAIISVIPIQDLSSSLPPYFFIGQTGPCTIERLTYPCYRGFESYVRARDKLLASLGEWREVAAAEEIGEAAFGLARCLLKGAWENGETEVVKCAQKQLYAALDARWMCSSDVHTSFLCGSECPWPTHDAPKFAGVEIEGCTTRIDEDESDETQSALDARFDELAGHIRVLSGKIASWGLAWSLDYEGAAWQKVFTTIAIEVRVLLEETQGKLMDIQ